MAEALIYNELAQEWPRLEELAESRGDGANLIEVEQPTLL